MTIASPSASLTENSDDAATLLPAALVWLLTDTTGARFTGGVLEKLYHWLQAAPS